MEIDYALRLRVKYLDTIKFEELLQKLFSEGSAYFFVEEKGSVEDNIHYQGIIRSRLNIDTLKHRVVKCIKVKGNQAYSLKTVRDQDRYHYYLMKGDSEADFPKVVKSHIINFSKEKIKEMHNQYWFNKNNTKDKSKDMITYLYDKLKVYEDGDIQHTIIKEVVNYYLVNKKPMNEFHMKSQIKLLNCMLSEDYKTILINRLLRDL